MIATRTLITIDPDVFAKVAAALSFEERGFYVSLLAAMRGDMTSIPACERTVGELLSCDCRTARRLLGGLKQHGLLESRYGVRRSS